MKISGATSPTGYGLLLRSVCAQMVLEAIGAGILDQDDLYADNHSHSTLDSGVGWFTGPDGLEWTLNDRRPSSFRNYFALFALDTEDQISRKICWTIHHYQVAPVALVYGFDHWVVVRGYTASAHPSSSADNSYAIDGFDLNNPWPYAPSFITPSSAPPPMHSVNDGCGTGGDRGIANEHVTYATWQSTYMTGIPMGYWNGKFVAVCDPEPPPNRGGERTLDENDPETAEFSAISVSRNSPSKASRIWTCRAQGVATRSTKQ